MTARTIASRLLENDEDFDPLGEIKRMTTTHPGYEVESEGNHWNVYKIVKSNAPAIMPDLRSFIGEITYDDMADMPKETMTPENIAYWDSHHWYAKWGWRDNEHKMCKSFEDAVNLIIAAIAVKTRVRESEDDPDNPELYVKPEQFSGQPSEEKIESSLRVMLRPYYPEVRINRRPGLFARRGASIGGKPIEDSYVWTIHCNRDSELPLPSNRYGITPYVDWRKLATQWFHDWARAHGLHIFKFGIFGRLRKDPTFEFETTRIGPLKESEDDELSPETILASYVDKDAAQEDLLHALWNFHPYGVSYNVLLGPRGGFALATLYFPPEKDNFYQRFEAFVVDWITKRKLFQITSTKLTGGKHANSEPYPRWGLTLALNSDWPSDTAPYVPAAVEIGQP